MQGRKPKFAALLFLVAFTFADEFSVNIFLGDC